MAELDRSSSHSDSEQLWVHGTGRFTSKEAMQGGIQETLRMYLDPKGLGSKDPLTWSQDEIARESFVLGAIKKDVETFLGNVSPERLREDKYLYRLSRLVTSVTDSIQSLDALYEEINSGAPEEGTNRSRIKAQSAGHEVEARARLVLEPPEANP